MMLGGHDDTFQTGLPACLNPLPGIKLCGIEPFRVFGAQAPLLVIIGIDSKMDGRCNYTLGIPEQIVFPEIVLDKVSKINGMNITFVTTAKTDEEGFALLKELGLPFKKLKNN